MALRPFRFALTIGDVRNRAALVEVLRRAEDAGFDVLAGVDHIGPPLGVLPLLSVVAELSRLRVSSMVIANDYRHPVLVAQDAATIDVLSGGRFELGIGTGWIKSQYDAAGLRYDPPRVKVDRLKEAITVIKGCWTGEPFAFDGTHYRVDVTGHPVPVQRPHPPILIGAAGARMLGLAGREADIVGITVTRGQTGLETFAHAVATSGRRIEHQLALVREAAGDRFEDLELSVMIHHLISSEKGEEGVSEFAAETGTTLDEVLSSPHVLVGPAERMVDALEERRERYGLSYVVFRGPQSTEAAPVVGRLSGT